MLHHKTGEIVWHPLDEMTSSGPVKFYPEARSSPRRTSSARRALILKGRRGGGTDPFRSNHMAKLVRRLADQSGLPKTFTPDACRHGVLTESEEAALTTGQVKALSGHRGDRAYAGYAKRTMERALAATRKQRAHVLANEQGTIVQNAGCGLFRTSPGTRTQLLRNAFYPP